MIAIMPGLEPKSVQVDGKSIAILMISSWYVWNPRGVAGVVHSCPGAGLDTSAGDGCVGDILVGGLGMTVVDSSLATRESSARRGTSLEHASAAMRTVIRSEAVVRNTLVGRSLPIMLPSLFKGDMKKYVPGTTIQRDPYPIAHARTYSR